MKLGAGREKKEDKIDLAVGIMLGGKVGDIIRKGEPIATIYANDESKLEWAFDEIKKYILLSDEPVERPTLIFE
jgi:pyrimidine-nucleoside phosphorylase